MSWGKGTAACGHIGTCVVGQYYKCDAGCDAQTTTATQDQDFGDEDTLDEVISGECPKCNSPEIALFGQFYSFRGSVKHCWGCGHVWS
jgi:hypothetical protein